MLSLVFKIYSSCYLLCLKHIVSFSVPYTFNVFVNQDFWLL